MTVKIPPRENLDYTIAVHKLDCVCPRCGLIHHKKINLVYQDRTNTWKHKGYIVALCNNCRRSENG